MKIRPRLILLIACLLAVFATATWLLQNTHRREALTIRADVEQQRASLLDRLLVLRGQSLQSFANDYSLWDDMVALVRTGDRDWAKINIEDSLVNFDAQAAWVLRPDGSLVCRTGTLDAKTLTVLPFGQPAFLDALRRQRMMHFYLVAPSGLLEVRTAPIQPSNDAARARPERGWFLVVRLWSASHLQTLADTFQGSVSFDPQADQTADPANIRLQRELSDWTGRPVRTLHVNYRSLALSRLLEGNQDETYVFFIFGLVMIAVTTLSLSRWVITPLHQLGQSLETGRPDTLRRLRGAQNEFGHLARQVEFSFSQRAELQREVQERSRLAEELQEAGTRLHELIELRSRLARDLHDGVIQSIYAAGLSLEGVRVMLQTDLAAADRRLVGCQDALNDTIRDVRAFINELESESSPPRPFRQTLAALIATLQSVQPGNVTLAVDETVACRINPAQEMQILQVLRESISNALRHAAPASIQISLQAGEAGGAVLTVADDGHGFDPTIPPGRGHGLVNLGIRARELAGSLQIDSAPGKGTRIILRFNPTYPSCL